MSRYLLDNGVLVAYLKGRAGAVRLIRPWVIAQEAVRFLARFEIDRIDLHKCPPFIREWIALERRTMGRHGELESNN